MKLDTTTEAEARIRKLEAQVRQLMSIETLRLMGAEQQRFLSTSTITVVAGVTALGAIFVLLSRMV
jgi:hypothetical protein